MSLEEELTARRYREQRDRLVRLLRREDPGTWTLTKLAREVGCSKELIAHILRQPERPAVLGCVAPGRRARGCPWMRVSEPRH